MPAGHALADVVVRIAFQVQVQAAGIPDAEALSDVARETHRQRRILHAVVAPAPGDFAGQPRADRAVEVLDLVVPLAAGLTLDGGQHVAHHPLGELALVERRVRRSRAELRHVARKSGR